MDRTSLDFDIQRSRLAYPTITPSPYWALQHFYCCYGNGYEWFKAKNGELYLDCMEARNRKSRWWKESKYAAVEKHLLKGITPNWPLEPATFCKGVYDRDDVIALTDYGRATWDHTQKRDYYYGMCEFSLLHELASGQAYGIGEIKNVRRDLIEGGLAMCDLILELGPTKPEGKAHRGLRVNEEERERQYECNKENFLLTRKWKPEILNRWYGEGVRSYLVQLDQGASIYDLLQKMLAHNGVEGHTLVQEDNYFTLTIGDDTYAALASREMMADEELCKQSSWLLFFHREFPQEATSVFLPYLSYLVVQESTKYARQQAYDEVTEIGNDGFLERWLPMTPEERAADREMYREKMRFGVQRYYDAEGNPASDSIVGRVDLYVPDPEPLIAEHYRRAALTDEEREAEDRDRKAKADAILEEIIAGLKDK